MLLWLPYLARMIVGPNFKVLLPATALIGSTYLLLVDNVARTISHIKIGEAISEDERTSVYYVATGSQLTTNVEGSIHTQAIDFIGAKNAAEVTVEKMSGGVDVSMEQVLEWDPELIIVAKAYKGEDGSYETIIGYDTWSSIKVVEGDNVYAIPNEPFNWFDKPLSINRIIGVRWLGNLIYPEYFDIDIKQETKDFY